MTYQQGKIMFPKPQYCLFSVLFLVVGLVSATEDDSPQFVAKEYFKALKDSNYEKAAGLYRENDLVEFKSLFMPIYYAEQESGGHEFIHATFGKGATINHVEDANLKTFFSVVIDFVFSSNPAGKTIPTTMKIIGEVEEKEKIWFTSLQEIMCRSVILSLIK